MILKIERYVDNEAWVIFDNLKEISEVDLKVGDLIGELPRWNPHILILDFCNNNPDILDQTKIDCILLRCKSAIGAEGFSVAFDTVAYLCNDLGQTIEKMVANLPREKVTVNS